MYKASACEGDERMIAKCRKNNRRNERKREKGVGKGKVKEDREVGKIERIYRL